MQFTLTPDEFRDLFKGPSVDIDLSVNPNGALMAAVLNLDKRMSKTQADQTALLQTIATGLTDVGAQLTKALGEVTSDVADLKAKAAAAGNSTPEMDALFTSIQGKMTGIQATAKTLDDLHPDAAVPPGDIGKVGGI